MLRTGLTEEQSRNTAIDEDVTLILAGAGTGKTAVITGKIAHLVHNQDLPAESILAMAFNRKAALEIPERLPQDLKEAQVSTFHSSAGNILPRSPRQGLTGVCMD
jgi:superfamily I DNA/RNA helicase